jgi:probable rRNA maturation factor
MIWEGLMALPFVLAKKVIVVEHKTQAVNARALSLFAGKAQRALGIRGEVNIHVTSNRELQKLNRRFRRTDKPTDVLSFPSAVPKLAGDIAISADIAAASAADLGHSTETEMKVLILHGLLHLAGYDHERDDGDMQARERELRKQLKLPAGLIERTNSRSERRAAGSSDERKRRGSRP